MTLGALSDKGVSVVPFPYTVKPGDNLSAIARRFNVGSWQEIYNLPENAEFRRRRPNPNLIFPNDVVMIPGTVGDPGLEECMRQCQQRFAENVTLPSTDRIRQLRRCQRECRGVPV
jgi:hypothetical protein